MGIVHLALAAERPVLVLGDSLSAGYGVDMEQGWVALLQQRLSKSQPTQQVINASISGDTTRGALTRLPKALEQYRPGVVIIELGGNDGLRGISLEEMARNLRDMVDLCRQQGTRVLLLGMRLPPNYGLTYSERFHAVYRTLAEQSGVALVPFFLKGVAEDRTLMQPDGIHPRAEAQGRLLENVWPYLEPLLDP